MRVVPALDELRRIGRAAGLDALGVTSAAPFEETRLVLETRKAEGLAAGMQFTYRNPDRSTDPSRIVAGAQSVLVGARSYLRRGGSQPVPVPGLVPGPPPAPVPAPAAGRVARYAWVDHYEPLRRALGSVAGALQAQGWQARVVADDTALVDETWLNDFISKFGGRRVQ